MKAIGIKKLVAVLVGIAAFIAAGLAGIPAVCAAGEVWKDDLADGANLFDKSDNVAFYTYAPDVPMRDLTAASGAGGFVVYRLPENADAASFVIYAYVKNREIDPDFRVSSTGAEYGEEGFTVSVVKEDQPQGYYCVMTYTLTITDNAACFVKIGLPEGTGAWWDYSLASAEFFGPMTVTLVSGDNCSVSGADTVSVSKGGAASFSLLPDEGYVFKTALDQYGRTVGHFDAESGIFRIENIDAALTVTLYFIPDDGTERWLVRVLSGEGFTFGASGSAVLVADGGRAEIDLVFDPGYSYAASDFGDYDRYGEKLVLLGVQGDCIVTVRAIKEAADTSLYTVRVTDTSGRELGLAEDVPSGSAVSIALRLPEGVGPIAFSTGNYDIDTGILTVPAVTCDMNIKAIYQKDDSGSGRADPTWRTIMIATSVSAGVILLCFGVTLCIGKRKR